MSTSHHAHHHPAHVLETAVEPDTRRSWSIWPWLAVVIVLMGAVFAAHAGGFLATAKCNDGTYSYSRTPQGACNLHSGVAEFYR